MKRTLTLLTVVALMVAMLAMTALPAFAAWDPMTGCRTDDTRVSSGSSQQTMEADRNNDGFVCMRGGNKTRFYDNRT